MLNQIFRHTLAQIAICAATLAITVLGTQADELFKYPDFSGQWGRDMLFFEPPPSGPGPVVRAERKADGTMVVQDPCCTIANRWLGDHANPILKPEAAEAVKKFGDLAFTGTVTPDLHNTCWPEPLPMSWGCISGCRFWR